MTGGISHLVQKFSCGFPIGNMLEDQSNQLQKQEFCRLVADEGHGISSKINETGSLSPCMRPRSDPPNFGPIERGEKQTNNID